MTNSADRVADYPIDQMFLARWSPRAFSPGSISPNELMTILEAARWAPSAFNAQPWRFVYAHRETEFWDSFLDLLVPRNREWARRASALVFLISKSTVRLMGSDREELSTTFALDAGAASGYLALQAHLTGWHVHGMAGFDHHRAREVLNLPNDHVALAVYAIGRLAPSAVLPEALRAREHPSSRVPLTELAFEGSFQAS